MLKVNSKTIPAFDEGTARAEFEVKEMMKAKYLEVFAEQMSKLDEQKYTKMMKKMFDLALHNPNATLKDKKQLVKTYEMNQPIRKLLSGLNHKYV